MKGPTYMKRIPKDQYYLNIAREVAARSTCLKRNYGCVIVKNDEIIAKSYVLLSFKKTYKRQRANKNAMKRCSRARSLSHHEILFAVNCVSS